MPIRWNALKVKEAADKVEELIKQAAGPLEQARIVIKEARNLPNLPQYIEGELNSISAEIERVTGSENSWNKEHLDGTVKRAIDRLRRDIPQDTRQSRAGQAHDGQSALIKD